MNQETDRQKIERIFTEAGIQFEIENRKPGSRCRESISLHCEGYCEVYLYFNSNGKYTTNWEIGT